MRQGPVGGRHHQRIKRKGVTVPQYLISEPAETAFATLGDALDVADVGILLLNHELRVRFINRRQADVFGLSPALLATGPTFRDLLRHAADAWIAGETYEPSGYVDQQEAAVRNGSVPPTRIDFKDGRRMLFSCVACPDGGRIITYTEITRELRHGVTEAVDRIQVELRFRTETLEDQAAYLVSLAEASDESARTIEEARLDLERKIVEHRQLEVELRRLATTDGLTGALNRAAFFTFAQQRLEQGQNLAVLMLDVDHFKAINDRYGHAGGDVALQHLVATLRTETREEDLLGRLGGEEFAVVLPVVLPDEALLVAERLRSRIAETPILHGDRLIQMTISVGVAAQRSSHSKIDQLMAHADAALYRAKGEGRNRVMMAESVVAA